MKTTDRYYLLVLAEDTALLETLRAAHAVSWPQNQLGVSPSLDGSKAIVKVDWGDAAPNVGADREIPWVEAVRLVDSIEWRPA